MRSLSFLRLEPMTMNHAKHVTGKITAANIDADASKSEIAEMLGRNAKMKQADEMGAGFRFSSSGVTRARLAKAREDGMLIANKETITPAHQTSPNLDATTSAVAVWKPAYVRMSFLSSSFGVSDILGEPLT